MSQLIPSTTPNRVFQDHTGTIWVVAVFPDRRRMVTGSYDKTLCLWDLKTGVALKKMEGHHNQVLALAVSRDGQMIASSDKDGEFIVWHGETGEPIKAHSNWLLALDFSPDSTVLATSSGDGTTKLWCMRLWQSQRNPIECRAQTWAFCVTCVTFSMDSQHILSGSADKMISEWEIPKDAWTEEAPKKPAAKVLLHLFPAPSPSISHLVGAKAQILAINMTVRNACIARELSTAEKLFRQEIDTDANNYTSYANCSFIMARKHDWENALDDAIKYVMIQPSLTGHISKGIALCGKGQVQDARIEFDLAIAIFNTDQHDEAILRVRKLAAACPNNVTLAFGVVEAYLRVQLGINALNGAHNDEAADHFAAAAKCCGFSSQLDIHSEYEDLVVIRKLREQYFSPFDAERAIRKVIDVQLNTAPLRLLNTTTGLLCNREAQISAFQMSTEYKELLLSIMKHPHLRMERTEPLLHDTKDEVVYELKAAGGLAKLQSFCKIARKAEYHWAWVDSCCIDQTNNVEVQTSLDSMFAWYRHSALTAVYLSDVPPSSKSGALSKSAWNTRGWTVPEFLAPKVIRFYQQDWTPYLNDESPNHKESVQIMDELEDATGIEARTLAAFQPGMRDAREKLQWASTRVTTRPEDIPYSLFGIFGVRLPIHYNEKSKMRSCLPADISSYAAPPCAFLSLSEDEIQISVSLLRNTVAVELASNLYDRLDNMSMSALRFMNCRLHLPCIAFRVTELRRRHSPANETHLTYRVKADGLDDLLISTEEKLIQFSRARPARQTFSLVRPWDRRLLEQPAFADDVESLEDWSEPGSPVEQELGDSESHSRALRLMVRLGQPFGAFLLAQQRGGEYNRIASDHDIIAPVKDMTSVHNMMGGVRTLGIL
ncbi:hypothetical protein DFH29DRAFT_1081064 [Suillus ampliporus]|nr:hypothetical protein DFH29DRAFT_1081064 [Suillus ampliporus]